MIRRIVITPAASQELENQTDRIAQADGGAARCFLAAVNETIKRLADDPDMSAPFEVPNPRLQDLRWWPIRGFKKYLVLFRTLPDAIEVLHILHSSQDVFSILEKD